MYYVGIDYLIHFGHFTWIGSNIICSLLGVNTDVVDGHCILFGIGFPSRQPLVALLPERAHLSRARRWPGLIEWSIDAAIREKVSSNGHIEDQVELKKWTE